MEESIVTDLISRLRYGHVGGLSRRDAKPEVRQQAAEYMCSLTSSKDGCEMIAKQQGHLALAKLLGDSIVISVAVSLWHRRRANMPSPP